MSAHTAPAAAPPTTPPTSTPAAATPAPPLGAAFWRIWATQTVSVVGSTVSGVGVAVHVYVRTGDARWLGVLAALAAVPALLASPWLHLLDRWSRRQAMIVGDCLAVAGPVGALVVAAVGDLRTWHLLVAAALGGVGNAVQTPALGAAVPALVGSTDPAALARANGLFQLGPAAGIVAGPAIATALVAHYGLEAVLWVDVVTFLLALAALTATRFADLPTAGSRVADDGSWRSAARWLRRDGRPLVTLLAMIGVVNLCLAFFNVAIVVVATDVGGVAWAGLPIAVGGLAMVASALLAPRTGVARRPVRVAGLALLLVAAGCTIAAVRPWFPLVVVGVALALAPVAVVNGGIATLFQTRVPVAMHGRVFAVRSAIGRSLDPLGAAVAGVVIAELAAPAMAPGGALAATAGRVLGTGAPRGAALVLGLTGLVLGLLALRLLASAPLATLDEPPPAAAVAG